ncbi:D-ribose pyranase [Salinisphaera sp. USBA-960]|uniref:D-ribose pyranase n=1 Tax=Salinisphaera orenii TaxID=856731 RepID=UPI000DBE5E58|nr:D-ribose pyranase [Salifodinibacter halophilus]NNC26139.1 D-ribose pyranase [Salifodinibacter halophilus]
MKRDGILHPALNFELCQLGHGDRFAIADAGLPIPPSVTRIDLAFSPGQPDFLNVLTAILSASVIEGATVAQEFGDDNERRPEFEHCLQGHGGISPSAITYLTHEQLKTELTNMRFVVRTGETTPFCNVILQSGVFFG